jgi:hypothetical protein
MPDLEHARPSTIRDAAWQTAYRLGFPLARIWWRLRRQRQTTPRRARHSSTTAAATRSASMRSSGSRFDEATVAMIDALMRDANADAAAERQREKARSRIRAQRLHQGRRHWHVNVRSTMIVCRACGANVPKHVNPQSCRECGSGNDIGTLAVSTSLRRSGALGEGCVSDVVVENSRKTILSRIIRLSLSCKGAAAEAPGSLIRKTGLPERVDAKWNSGRHEVAFYMPVAAAMSAHIVPRCFDVVWDPDTNAWHLLLEDLTDSHFVLTNWPLPPTLAQSKPT